MKELEEIREHIQVAVAQGWCVPPNTHKAMDCDLAEAIVNNVMAALDAHDADTRNRALEQFTAYFVENYPGPHTIIYDPKWHAPRIFRAAMDALKREKRGGE